MIFFASGAADSGECITEKSLRIVRRERGKNYTTTLLTGAVSDDGSRVVVEESRAHDKYFWVRVKKNARSTKTSKSYEFYFDVSFAGLRFFHLFREKGGAKTRRS